MTEHHIDIAYRRYAIAELPAEERALVEQARQATATSYSPYSRFQVGAALRLADGRVFTGSNQENAAYPTGMCAERTAFFAAQATAPDVPPVAIAIAAQTAGRFTPRPVTPCGQCRQALLEAETRYRRPIRVLLAGADDVYAISSMGALLPLNFDGSELER